jgi:hypothetical protein
MFGDGRRDRSWAGNENIADGMNIPSGPGVYTLGRNLTNGLKKPGNTFGG